MDGFTGFNPQQATTDMNTFHDAISAIYEYGKDQFSQFNKGMIESWYSPTAKEKSKFILEASYIGAVLNGLNQEILSSARGAIKVMARQHGMEFDYDINSLGGKYETTSLNDSGPMGVGMNKITVGILMDNLKAAVNKICADLDSLPTNLAVYDPTNQLESAYADLIKKSSSFIKDYFNDTIAYIVEYMETEVHNLYIGVNNATQELAG